MDAATRFVAEIAPKYLGQPITVVNKVGAAGSIAAADVINSKPDGYKIANLYDDFFGITVKMQKIPFDPDYLVPIANIMEVRTGLFVNGNSPWKTLADLLDYARKNPGKLRWAHSGRGIPPHLNVLIIFRKAGVVTNEVPYRGGTEVLPALLGGHVDAATGTHGSFVDHLKAGSVRYLVLYSDHRYRDLPDVPCATELGFPEAGKLGSSLSGYYVHKDTPEKIKETLFDFFKKASEDPELTKRIEKLGEQFTFGGPEFIKRAIKEAEEVGVPMLKELGLYVGK
jgi:tripartite-type tricarboxylate transporter receptor subunit TctC